MRILQAMPHLKNSLFPDAESDDDEDYDDDNQSNDPLGDIWDPRINLVLPETDDDLWINSS